MKLRLRTGAKTHVVKLDTKPSTIGDLKICLVSLVSCRIPPGNESERSEEDDVIANFEVSLNGRDVLADDLTLKESDLRSGDLLHVLGDTSLLDKNAKISAAAHQQVSVAQALENILCSKYGFVAEKKEAQRRTYSLRKKGSDAVARAEFVFSDLHHWCTIHATVLGTRCGVYSLTLRKDESFDCEKEVSLLDKIVLPIVRDSSLKVGANPPALLDTVKEELVLKILASLGPEDLGKLCCVSKVWNHVASDDSLWDGGSKDKYVVNLKKKRKERMRMNRSREERADRLRRLSSGPRFRPHEDHSFPGREAFIGGRLGSMGPGRGGRNRRIGDRFRLV